MSACKHCGLGDYSCSWDGCPGNTPPGAEAEVERLSSPNVVALAKALHEERIRAESAEARVREMEMERDEYAATCDRMQEEFKRDMPRLYTLKQELRYLREVEQQLGTSAMRMSDLRTQLRTLREAVGPLVSAVEGIANYKPGFYDRRDNEDAERLADDARDALAAYRSATEGKNG
jgi:chromosome segregation ATPase